MIIDSHCHLNYDPLINSIPEIIKRAEAKGIKYMLTISTKDKEFSDILDLVNKYKNIYGTYGIHPHEAESHENITVDTIINNVKKNNKIIGVGETGLDFYYNNSKKNIQIDLFIRHIEASIETNKPIIVHTRNAENETYDVLKKISKKDKLKILIHCFTGSKKFAYNLLDLGCYISASGIITFKKSKILAETFKDIPLNKILVETDAPYLSPEPLRGKTNEPSHLIHTLKFLSEIKKIDLNLLAKSTSKNFLDLFGKLI